MAVHKITKIHHKENVDAKPKTDKRQTREVQKNVTFGLLLIALLIAGFSFGAILGLVNDSSNSQSTTYTREAKAYNSPTGDQLIQSTNQNYTNR